MSLGAKFWIKYAICFIPMCLIYIPSFFMPKDKAIEYRLKNRLANILVGWIGKEW